MQTRAEEIKQIITQAQDIHIITHIDADGIAAGAIASRTLDRLGKQYSLEFVKQLDESIMKNVADANHELVWFTDLGSSICTQYPDISKIITDHHHCPPDSNFEFHLNPHLFGYDGSIEISGSGVTYLIARAINSVNKDLSALAIVGACGDLQDKRFGRLQGMNQQILKDGKSLQILDSHLDICYFGRETRPLPKFFQFANNPLIPGVSGREYASIAYLEELEVPLKDGDVWRHWIDLAHQEKQHILSSIAQRLLQRGFGAAYVRRLISEVYILPQESLGSELHDAKEYATLLNSTARYGQYEVGMQVCLGDRDDWLEKARNLLRGHRQNLVEALQFVREEPLIKKDYVQYFHAKNGVRDTILGIVTNMLLNSEDIDKNLPLIGFAYTETGAVKVSARADQYLVDRGLNLSKALKQAAKQIDGVGGGHSIAAGATIPNGKEDDFIQLVEQNIQDQFSK